MPSRLITQPGSVLRSVHGEYGKVMRLFPYADPAATTVPNSKTAATTIERLLTDLEYREEPTTTAVPMKYFHSHRETTLVKFRDPY